MIFIQMIALMYAAVRKRRGLRFLAVLFLFMCSIIFCSCGRRAEEPVLETVLTEADEAPATRGYETNADGGSPENDTGSSLENAAGSTSGNDAGTMTEKSSGGTPENAPGRTDDEQNMLTVHVCGAVKKEGIYTLPAGSRIFDAIEAAGGFTEDADRSYLNLATVLEDAWQIRVPTVKETEEAAFPTGQGDPFSGGTAAGQTGSGAENGEGRINLNTASKEELMKIPGVGEAKAQRIIEYREQNGRFEAIEDLMKVPGIKEASFQKMKDYITV